MANQTVDNVTVAVNSNAEPEEISDSFICCICLDLLYKPIVLPCGHITCFWCVHKSMSSIQESRCSICRRTYNHFPCICEMLHRLLLKMYPIAYKKRENQILEEEKKLGFFSPQFDNYASGPLVDNEFHHLTDPVRSFRVVGKSTSKGGSHEKMECLESASLALNNGTNEKTSVGGVTVTEKNLLQISIDDALCTACKQLLIHPVVLNCGHVYCETCIIIPTELQLKCEVCQCLNPSGFPKVCLGLDQFLEEQFCEEYALRRDAVQLKKVQLKHESGTTCPKGAASSKTTGKHLSLLADPHLKVHVGCGCDSCGMFPIIGDRYRCKDCMEASGFDLCGDCYRTRSKLPGRFNQQHIPEHRLELVKSNSLSDMMMRFITGRVGVGSNALVIADDVFEENESPVTLPNDAQEITSSDLSIDLSEFLADDVEEENGSPVNLPNDAQESTSSDLTTAIVNSDNSIDQNNTESRD